MGSTPDIILTRVDLPCATWPIVPILTVACPNMTSFSIIRTITFVANTIIFCQLEHAPSLLTTLASRGAIFIHRRPALYQKALTFGKQASGGQMDFGDNAYFSRANDILWTIISIKN